MSSSAPTLPAERAFHSELRAEQKLERYALVYELSKRLVDILGASCAILVSFPLLIGIAVAIRATTAGPILFRHRRLGRGGVEFWCYKFRTMVVDAEQLLETDHQLRDRFQESYKLKIDPRTTRIGVWLRKTSLDELPQLFNILTGTMSLIGPRPIVAPERAKYHEFADKLLSVKPGLGGYWQVYGRSNTTYTQRVEMDMTYIDNRSLLADLKLLVLTILVALKRQGALLRPTFYPDSCFHGIQVLGTDYFSMIKHLDDGPLRLLVISHLFAPDVCGGAAIFSDMCYGLAERNIDVTVRCGYPYYPEWKDKSGNNGIRIECALDQGVRIERYGMFIRAIRDQRGNEFFTRDHFSCR